MSLHVAFSLQVFLHLENTEWAEKRSKVYRTRFYDSAEV